MAGGGGDSAHEEAIVVDPKRRFEDEVRELVERERVGFSDATIARLRESEMRGSEVVAALKGKGTTIVFFDAFADAQWADENGARIQAELGILRSVDEEPVVWVRQLCIHQGAWNE